MFDIFVFAGQSNMMGASVLPPKHRLNICRSYEYRFSPVMRGADKGSFVPVTYDCGEFLYKNPDAAYSTTDENGKSTLADYGANADFVCAMCNLNDYDKKTVFPFAVYSESNHVPGASLPPYLCERWEALGGSAVIAHIAKGGVNINHFFSADMENRYNSELNKRFDGKYQPVRPREHYGAAEVFDKKCLSLFSQAKDKYGENELGEKILFWLQGENNSNDSDDEYELKLEILWNHAKALGFDKMMIIRIGYWWHKRLVNIMRAQERFCSHRDDCFIVTRAMSFMPDVYNVDCIDEWYTEKPQAEYYGCRDSFDGFNNNHINEKGFMLIADRTADNLWRILKEGKQPTLEKDIVRGI